MRTNERFYVSSKRYSFSLAQGKVNCGAREMAIRAIGIDKGKPWRVDAMANAFPAGIPGIKQERTDTEWLRVWGAFVVRYAERRSQSGSD